MSLNENAIGTFDGTGEALEFDITGLLRDFSILTVDIAFDPKSNPNVSGGLYGPVALEIRWDPTSEVQVIDPHPMESPREG